MSNHALIGQRIKEEREAAGYTQAQLAERVAIDDTVLSRIENGQRGIDSLILRRVARTLDVPMDHFFAVHETVAMARNGDSENVRAMVEWASQMKADLSFVREAARRYG